MTWFSEKGGMKR